MLIIGSHVSFGKEQILGALDEALSYGANTFMFYTGAPTNTVRKDINEDVTLKALDKMKENNIDINNVICHAPYIVNPATSDLEKRKFCVEFIKKELARCDFLHISKMVLHPGSAVGITPEEGIKNIISVLNEVLDGSTKCKVLIETMAGKGSECGRTIDEVAEILNGVNKKDQIGVCIDTCHIYDGGYDIKDFDSYLEEFDSKIGIDKIGCIHVNDSKNELGSHKDRHANIGVGNIGFDALLSVIYNEKLNDVPKILETPYIGETDDAKDRLYPPYKYEIEMIRNKKFDSSFRDKIREEYKK